MSLLALFALICSIAFGQDATLAAGERLFHLHCAECHGLDGEGGQGPNLTRGVFRHGSSDQAIYQTIAKGVPGTPMPANSLSDVQLKQLVSYVRALSGSERVTIPGQPAAGEKLYAGKGGCAKCHMIRGEGGRLGPDLTSIGSLRSPSHLRASILRPDEDVAQSHWRAEAVDGSGKTYSGIRMNEDSYTIQIMDLSENLHSLDKQSLRSLKIDRKKSWMPAYANVFSASELDDLVAYLYSLQRNARRP